MKINNAGLELIKEFEGFEADSYQDPVGIWTVGYGTTRAAAVGIDPKPGVSVTEPEGEYYLRLAVDKFASAILPKIKRPINQNEFSAFLSLAYNIGPGAFGRSSALKHFNAGDKQKAADSILLWNKAGGRVLRGLVRRREAEKALFLSPVSFERKPRPAAPTAEPAGFIAVILQIITAILKAFGAKK